MADSKHNQAWDDSLLEGENADYLEMLYEQYQESPDSLDSQWQSYFAALEQENQTQETPSIPLFANSFVLMAYFILSIMLAVFHLKF